MLRSIGEGDGITPEGFKDTLVYGVECICLNTFALIYKFIYFPLISSFQQVGDEVVVIGIVDDIVQDPSLETKVTVLL